MEKTVVINRNTFETLIDIVDTRNKTIRFMSNIKNLDARIIKGRTVGYEIRTCKYDGIASIIKDTEIDIMSNKQILFNNEGLFKGIFQNIKAVEIIFEGKEFENLTNTVHMFRNCDLKN